MKHPTVQHEVDKIFNWPYSIIPITKCLAQPSHLVIPYYSIVIPSYSDHLEDEVFADIDKHRSSIEARKASKQRQRQEGQLHWSAKSI